MQISEMYTPGLESPREALYPWYALKVRTNGEAKVKRALELKDYEVYLPTHIECRPCADRIKKVEAAFFPGYLFIRFNVNRRLPVLTTPGVERIVSPNSCILPVEESEIAAIQQVTKSGLAATPWPYLREGDQVAIKFGSLAGLTGLLVKFRGTERLILSVHMLQRSISVEIDRGWITPTNGTNRLV